MTEKITFEDVLDELMLEEPKPDYAALVRWREALSALPVFVFLLRDFVEMVFTYRCDFFVPTEERVVHMHH